MNPATPRRPVKGTGPVFFGVCGLGMLFLAMAAAAWHDWPLFWPDAVLGSLCVIGVTVRACLVEPDDREPAASPSKETALCVCGHERWQHIYHEGACRPGFVCGCPHFEDSGTTSTTNRLKLTTHPPGDLYYANSQTISAQDAILHALGDGEPRSALEAISEAQRLAPYYGLGKLQQALLNLIPNRVEIGRDLLVSLRPCDGEWLSADSDGAPVEQACRLPAGHLGECGPE